MKKERIGYAMKTISRDIYNAVEAFDKKLYFREDIVLSEFHPFARYI